MVNIEYFKANTLTFAINRIYMIAFNNIVFEIISGILNEG